MAHALDRVALTRSINKGLQGRQHACSAPGLPRTNRSTAIRNTTSAKAKQLLADYGKPVKIKLAVNASPIAVLSGQALQQMWKKVGIETEIDQFEADAADPCRRHEGLSGHAVPLGRRRRP